jgi:hypothetical protein
MTRELRCPDCDNVLPAPGAICHVCDVEAHFEGALRTAPPIARQQVTPPRGRGRLLRSDRRAS